MVLSGRTYSVALKRLLSKAWEGIQNSNNYIVYVFMFHGKIQELCAAMGENTVYQKCTLVQMTNIHSTRENKKKYLSLKYIHSVNKSFKH